MERSNLKKIARVNRIRKKFISQTASIGGWIGESISDKVSATYHSTKKVAQNVFDVVASPFYDYHYYHEDVKVWDKKRIASVVTALGLTAFMAFSMNYNHSRSHPNNPQRQEIAQTDNQNQSVVGNAYRGLDTITIPPARIDKGTDYDIVSTRYAKKRNLDNKKLASVEIPPINYQGTPKESEQKTKKDTLKVPEQKRDSVQYVSLENMTLATTIAKRPVITSEITKVSINEPQESIKQYASSKEDSKSRYIYPEVQLTQKEETKAEVQPNFQFANYEGERSHQEEGPLYASTLENAGVSKKEGKAIDMINDKSEFLAKLQRNVRSDGSKKTKKINREVAAIQAQDLRNNGWKRDKNGKFYTSINGGGVLGLSPNGDWTPCYIEGKISQVPEEGITYGLLEQQVGKDGKFHTVKKREFKGKLGRTPMNEVNPNSKFIFYAEKNGKCIESFEVGIEKGENQGPFDDKDYVDSGPKLGALEESLEYQIAEKDFWSGGRNNLEASVVDTNNYARKDSIKSSNTSEDSKYKFDRNKFSDYDGFKEDYLNGEEDTLKSIANKYGMSASTASRLGKELFGCLGRESARRVNGVYRTKRKGRNKRSYSQAA